MASSRPGAGFDGVAARAAGLGFDQPTSPTTQARQRKAMECMSCRFSVFLPVAGIHQHLEKL
jgi:hypothetical protein